MKVMHILSGDLWAGAEVMVRNLLQGLLDFQGMELYVVILNEGLAASEIKTLGIKTVIIDEKAKSFFDLFLLVRKQIIRFKPDIIHAHRYKENILAYFASRGLKKIGLIRTQHGMPETWEKSFSIKSKTLEIINLYLLSFCFDYTVTVSVEMKNILISKYRCSPKSLKTIHNGSSTIKINQKFKFDNNNLVIGSCGRLTAVKNFALLIDIAALLNQSFPNVTFHLAGDGPEMSKLLKLVRNNGLEKRFQFLGHIDDMTNFYSGIDIYINTSWHEGIPMSIIEAMEHGLPIIVPKVGGFTEIVTNGVDGYLVEEHTPFLFVEKCLKLLNNKSSRKKMGQSAKTNAIKHFSLQKMAVQYYQLYNQTYLM